MSNVVAFSAQASAPASMAVSRLNEIWRAVDSFTQGFRCEHVTTAEMMRILRIFNTANSCIRIVLSDFRNDPAIDQLVGYSCDITAMIEQARQKVVSLVEDRHDTVSSFEPVPASRLGD